MFGHPSTATARGLSIFALVLASFFLSILVLRAGVDLADGVITSDPAELVLLLACLSMLAVLWRVVLPSGG